MANSSDNTLATTFNKACDTYAKVESTTITTVRTSIRTLGALTHLAINWALVPISLYVFFLSIPVYFVQCVTELWDEFNFREKIGMLLFGPLFYAYLEIWELVVAHFWRPDFNAWVWLGLGVNPYAWRLRVLRACRALKNHVRRAYPTLYFGYGSVQSVVRDCVIVVWSEWIRGWNSA